MELCYEVELRIKRMHAPDKTGAGPFEPIAEPEAGMKLLIFPEVWANQETRAVILRMVGEALTRHYGELDSVLPGEFGAPRNPRDAELAG